MTVSLTKSVVTTITMSTDDLPFDAVLDTEPCEWIDPVVTRNGDNYVVAYAVHDEHNDGFHPIADSDGIVFEEFRTEWDRDAFIEAQDETDHVYVVNHYEHGSSVYTIAGSARTVVDPGGFDTRPSGVLVLSPDFTDPDAAAEAIMAEYTSWANGDVYIIHREEFDAKGERIDSGGFDTVGGFIGTEYAEQAVADIDNHL